MVFSVGNTYEQLFQRKIPALNTNAGMFMTSLCSRFRHCLCPTDNRLLQSFDFIDIKALRANQFFFFSTLHLFIHRYYESARFC